MDENFDPNAVSRRYETPSLALQLWATIPRRFPHARSTIRTGPDTDLEALMETPPNEIPATSAQSQRALQERIASYIDSLSPLDRRVIEAIFYEDLPLRTVAYRLGIPKTSVSRIRDRALQTLQNLMTRSPLIRERIVMQTLEAPPTFSDWEEAARSALQEICDAQFPVESYVTDTTVAIDTAYKHYQDWEPSQMWNRFFEAGCIAFNWLIVHYQHNEARLFEELIYLLVSRQAKYGHRNILKFEELGLCVRMSDKVARLANLEEGGFTFDDESVVDTWMDVVGYSVIASMLRDGTFTTELGS